MNETIIKRLGTLLSVKSIVTLVLTGVFAFLAITGQIAQDFYFGTQSQKVQDAVADSSTGGSIYNSYYTLPDEAVSKLDTECK